MLGAAHPGLPGLTVESGGRGGIPLRPVPGGGGAEVLCFRPVGGRKGAPKGQIGAAGGRLQA